MKTLILALGVAVVTASVFAANMDEKAAGDKEGHMKRRYQELGVTDEQLEKMREIRKQGGTRNDINAVLTPEQKAKAETLRSERKAKKAKHAEGKKKPVKTKEKKPKEDQPKDSAAASGLELTIGQKPKSGS